MKAAIYRSGGSPDVLELADVPTPEPGPGEVRVRMVCAGVNPTDWKALATATGAPEGFAIPVQDGAGVIDAVGPGVAPDRRGERVWVLLAAHSGRWGTAAEYSVVPADRAVPLAASASFELGASLGVPALTAWHCLSPDGRPLHGASVLVSGGAGAVGNMAIQLARWAGAGRVVATVSGPDKGRLAAGAGADHVITYTDDDAISQIQAAAPEGIDRFVEVALDTNLDLDLAVAAPHARLACYAATPDTVVTMPVRALMAANLTVSFMLLYTVTPGELGAAVRAISAAVAAGALSPLPFHRFPLADAAEALAAVRDGAVGKVLIDLPGA